MRGDPSGSEFCLAYVLHSRFLEPRHLELPCFKAFRFLMTGSQTKFVWTLKNMLTRCKYRSKCYFYCRLMTEALWKSWCLHICNQIVPQDAHRTCKHRFRRKCHASGFTSDTDTMMYVPCNWVYCWHWHEDACCNQQQHWLFRTASHRRWNILQRPCTHGNWQETTNSGHLTSLCDQ